MLSSTHDRTFRSEIYFLKRLNIVLYLFSTFSSSESSATSTGSGFIANPGNNSLPIKRYKKDLSLTCHCSGQELLDCPAGLGRADETPQTVHSLGEMLGVVLQAGRVELGQTQQVCKIKYKNFHFLD